MIVILGTNDLNYTDAEGYYHGSILMSLWIFEKGCYITYVANYAQPDRQTQK